MRLYSYLAKNTKVCYTYDSLSRVTARTVKNLNNEVQSEETFTYDAAGNITGASGGGSCVYDINNRLTSIGGEAVSYDMDGNMTAAPLGEEAVTFEYDSANRLMRAGLYEYTYNAEDLRIRSYDGEHETEYTYNPQAKLSQLLMKTTGETVTKYVYGLGLIGEEVGGSFKTYHFDYRGSTIAVTSESGSITDTFAYDTYGKQTARTGESDIIFGYNGKYGVVTEPNGLVYMRARYYSPELRRFINADVIAGEISNAITLNRYAYANGNPVSNIDPFGLSAERENKEQRIEYINSHMENTNNLLYETLKNLGFSLTKEVSKPLEYIDLLFGGIKVTLHIDVSFQTPFDAPINTDVSASSGKKTYEVLSPELTLPWADIGGRVGAYIDEERLSGGLLFAVRDGEWTYEYRQQIGLYSEASILSVSYQPEDKYLPTVTVSLDTEIHHLVTLSVIGLVAVAIFAPQAIIAAAPTAIEFIQKIGQIGSALPAFG